MRDVNRELHKLNMEIGEAEMELALYYYFREEYADYIIKLTEKIKSLNKKKSDLINYGCKDDDNLARKIKDILLTMVIDSGRKYQSKKKIK